MAKVKVVESNQHYLMFHCPGCNEKHVIRIAGDNPWCWNGDIDIPSITPSILVRSTDRVCHSFITDGEIRFFGDSTHSLKGKKVGLPDVQE